MNTKKIQKDKRQSILIFCFAHCFNDMRPIVNPTILTLGLTKLSWLHNIDLHVLHHACSCQSIVALIVQLIADPSISADPGLLPRFAKLFRSRRVNHLSCRTSRSFSSYRPFKLAWDDIAPNRSIAKQFETNETVWNILDSIETIGQYRHCLESIETFWTVLKPCG